MAPPSSQLPSSSSGFDTPMHPLRPFVAVATGAGPVLGLASRPAAAVAAVGAAGAGSLAPAAAALPILLPPQTLRPLAVRTFTKKHGLTLTSGALQELAAFIGRRCGSGWRDSGLADRVLEDTARAWKARNGPVIVDVPASASASTSSATASSAAAPPPPSSAATPDLRSILRIVDESLPGSRRRATADGRPLLARHDSLSSAALVRLDAPNGADNSSAWTGIAPQVSRFAAASQLGSPAADDADWVGSGVGADAERSGGGLRAWLRVIGAFEQPRMGYSVEKRHFERDTSRPSIFPAVSQKTALFQNRYNIIYQRLMRNETFQTSAVAAARHHGSRPPRGQQQQQQHRLTPIANLLGRHGSHHMLLGMLIGLPAGGLGIADPTGSITVDVALAAVVPADSAWFGPGMIVLVDGVYEEDQHQPVGRGLGGATGVGGLLGGRFQAFFVGQPPCETRAVTLGIAATAHADAAPDLALHSAGFGWIDFLGVGSERATGARMRRLERQLRASLRPSSPSSTPLVLGDAGRPSSSSSARIVLVAELHLDRPRTLQALRKILSLYAVEPTAAHPAAFVLMGNFTEDAHLGRTAGGGSIAYKEGFDALAAALADFPALLRAATFVLVPGDHDGWAAACAAGAAAPLPHPPVPDLFTSRIRRAFAASSPPAPDPVCTTNPARLSLFGPVHEIVLFRDDMTDRLRRTAVRLGASNGSRAEEPSPPPPPEPVRAGRKLAKTVLDQGFLAPFRPAIRPVHWDHAAALQLYPLPTALVLADPAAPPFAVVYAGCHVLNPGAVLAPGRRPVARWAEFEPGGAGGRLRESAF